MHRPSIIAFDFDAAVGAPFRMQPGLRRLAPGAPLLTPMAGGSRHQREKLAVLSACSRHALAAEHGFDAQPALQALAAQAAREHPSHFAWQAGRASAPTLGVAVQDDRVHDIGVGSFGHGDEVHRCLRALPAGWRLAGLLALAFIDDLAIVDGASATVPWIAACLPSHWAPQDKAGRHFGAIHAQVADNATLLRAGEHLMRLVCADERWERFVWNVTPEPRLAAHPAYGSVAWDTPHDAFADPAAPRAWLRTERQAFLPLPDRGEAVFTIAVDTLPLAQALATPGHAARLHDAIASMSEAVLDYRRLRAVRAPLLAWLAARARPA